MQRFRTRSRLHSDFFDVSRFFANSEKGAWYDPSDWSTLFQDSAGTIPVTAVNDPVGLMLDKSGNGYHASQATAINRPTLSQDANGKYRLLFNGTNSRMSTAAINFTATDKISVFAGVCKLSDAAFQAIAEISGNPNTNTGSFSLGAGTLTGDALRRTWVTVLSGSVAGILGVAGPYASPDTKVISLLNDLSQASSALETIMRLNGSQQTLTLLPTGASAGTGNFGNYPLYIGARNSSTNHFNGGLYGLIIRGADSTLAEIQNAEKYMNLKSGAY